MPKKSILEDNTKNTKIIQCFLPSLTAGEYQIKVKQVLKEKTFSKEVIEKEQTLGVDAARFRLGSQDVYSVYPPAETTGNYKNHLPHIVFNRKTLPWERTIDGNIPKYQEKKKKPSEIPPIPWMTLLLFDEEEMAQLKLEQKKLKNVLGFTKVSIEDAKGKIIKKEWQAIDEDDVLKPKISHVYKENECSLMQWESIEDSCMSIDISRKQFTEYVPSIESLKLQAHSKQVTITHKDKNGIEKNSEEKESGFFSVIMGRQLPKEKKTHTAILVSLEGFESYLKENSKSPSPNINDKVKNVRMVVLANWNFTCSGTTNFKELVDSIQVKPISVVYKNSKIPKVLQEYYKNGYMALNHKMRNGYKNISWYRGPFSPNPVERKLKTWSFSNTDEALYYDKNTGMFDVSVSAAWQLGRVLALQNQEYINAMRQWFQNPYEIEETTEVGYTSKENAIALFTGRYKTKTSFSKVKGEPIFKDIPKVAKDFLNRLLLLEDVPLNYLIPDEKYIVDTTLVSSNKEKPHKEGVLSMFYLDYYWMEALIDGALSIGRKNRDVSTVLNNVLRQVYMDNSLPKASSHITGFLLHSPLVAGWRGVEIKVYGENNKTETILKPLRFERISDTIFLGMFTQKITKIKLTQPYEGLHFGLKNSGTLSKVFKKEGGCIDGKKSIKVDVSSGLISKLDTLNLDLLSEELHKLEENNVPKYTSAEFAFQMVDSPIQHTFNIKEQKI